MSNVANGVGHVLEQIPNRLEEARPHLFPVIRHRSSHAQARLHCQFQGAAWTQPPSQALGETMVIELACGGQPLTPQALQRWQITFEQALAIATDNLRAHSPGSFCAVGPGLHCSPWQDGYDAARMLLPELIRKLPLKGNPVVAIPTARYLLLAGSDHEDGLALLSKYVDYVLRYEPCPLAGRAFTLEGDAWRPFLPPEGHVVRFNFEVLAAKDLERPFKEQQQLLQTLFKRRGLNVYVPEYTLRPNEKGDFRTTSTWPCGVPALLPKVDVIAFARTPNQILGYARWEDILPVVGQMLKKDPELYPERYRVEAFPNPSQLQAIGLHPKIP